MTAQQFEEWIAYYQIEPFGILAEDAISAHWKAIYANAHRKQGKPVIKTEKFLCFREKKVDASALFEDNGDDWEMSEDMPENDDN